MKNRSDEKNVTKYQGAEADQFGGGGGGGGHRRMAISPHHLDIVSSDVYFSTLLNAENKN
ncbi:hypothetical protein T4E_1113 [Trichinella pseudospiralis]|uniref:Uncharacterized protein n=1 Tax=Trichinella pseudospiralis TaxID=6337 RepID=A0A0V0Y7M5_TRIPS|nr:hypothetical protein T4E_1113 [Trichinella pseudospiralis]